MGALHSAHDAGSSVTHMVQRELWLISCSWERAGAGLLCVRWPDTVARILPPLLSGDFHLAHPSWQLGPGSLRLSAAGVGWDQVTVVGLSYPTEAI